MSSVHVSTKMAIAMLLCGFALATVPASATEVPKRKLGHWELTTVTPGVGKRVFDICVTDKDNIAIPENAGECGEPEVLDAGSETIVNVTCMQNGAKQVISTALSGDFDKRYHAVVKMTFDPPMGGMDHFGMTIDGKFVSTDCPETEGQVEEER